MDSIEIKCMVDKYRIEYCASGQHAGQLCVRNLAAAKRDNLIPTVRDHKPEIVAYLTGIAAAERRAADDRKAKIASIEGLSEIRRAIADNDRYSRSYVRMMDNEGNDGVNPPVRPTSNVSDLCAKYPRAAAYLNAESYSLSHNNAKASIGSEAMARIEDGYDYKAAIKAMQDKWSAEAASALLR